MRFFFLFFLVYMLNRNLSKAHSEFVQSVCLSRLFCKSNQTIDYQYHILTLMLHIHAPRPVRVRSPEWRRQFESFLNSNCLQRSTPLPSSTRTAFSVTTSYLIISHGRCTWPLHMAVAHGRCTGPS